MRGSRGKLYREGRNDDKEDNVEKRGNNEQEEGGSMMMRGEMTRHEQSWLALLLFFLKHTDHHKSRYKFQNLQIPASQTCQTYQLCNCPYAQKKITKIILNMKV